MINNYIKPVKANLKQVRISDVDIELPDLKNVFETKAVVVGKWLIKYIEKGIKTKKIAINDILPKKSEFAYKLGVSIGTVQKAFRYIEDFGYVESKQCIGTLIKDYTQPAITMRKFISKRDLAAEEIKRYIQTNGFKIGMILPSYRTLSTIIGYNPNTTKLAIDYLCNHKILEYKHSPKSCLIVKTMDFDTAAKNSLKIKTLVELVVCDLENYISQNLKVGDNLPSNHALASHFKVSLKTIHDASKILADKGYLLPRRGAYGTTVIKIPNDVSLSVKPEMSIFAPAKDAVFYRYEKIQNKIKRMIAEEYDIGEKLPSIMEMSKSFDVSPNTIRNAFHNLADEGYIVFSRGRYGGTFIIDIPEVEKQAFKWLAVNPQYVTKEQGVN